MYRVESIVVAGLLAACVGLVQAAPPLDPARAASAQLWDTVELQISRLRGELGFAELSPPVRQALEQVPRHLFVPEPQRAHAYENRPLPIGYGQTISQPLIVALMTELLAVGPGDRVFELGTGSGYQAAVLDALGCEVYSVEIIPELARSAREVLDAQGHADVQTRIGDGYFGWPEAATFDAVIVTAASDHIPPPLVQQLKPGGRMLIPVGGRYATQQLVLVMRDEQGLVTTREITPVHFVPLTGQR
jgi:protein-L-isoaspartate(D-aspartate) O-methyltransferase